MRSQSARFTVAGGALELIEQLDSLFGLRHCGRRLPRRDHPSAYGQMGRCLSPCLGDLDPNLYRRRLDEVLSLFTTPADNQPLLDHVDAQMRAAARQQRYERAASLRRRAKRLGTILHRLGGVLEATHARPRLILAAHPSEADRSEAFWLAGGRLVDYGPVTADDITERTERALSRAGRAGELGAHVPPARGRRGEADRQLAGVASRRTAAAAAAGARRRHAGTLLA